MKKYIIYGLKDKNDIIRYIGFTSKTLHQRLQKHLFEAKWQETNNKDKFKKYTHKLNWIRQQNFDISIVLLEDNIFNFELAQEMEIKYIKLYTDKGVKLVNSTIGGEGIKEPSQEVREKLRVANLGKKHTDKTKEKQSLIKKDKYKGENNPFFGKTHSQESKNKIIQTHKNNKYWLGKTHSQESKNKMKNGNSGENNKNFKIKDIDCYEIFRLVKIEKITMVDVAKNFGVFHTVIRGIINGRSREWMLTKYEKNKHKLQNIDFKITNELFIKLMNEEN